MAITCGSIDFSESLFCCNFGVVVGFGFYFCYMFMSFDGCFFCWLCVLQWLSPSRHLVQNFMVAQKKNKEGERNWISWAEEIQDTLTYTHTHIYINGWLGLKSSCYIKRRTRTQAAVPIRKRTTTMCRPYVCVTIFNDDFKCKSGINELCLECSVTSQHQKAPNHFNWLRYVLFFCELFISCLAVWIFVNDWLCTSNNQSIRRCNF